MLEKRGPSRSPFAMNCKSAGFGRTSAVQRAARPRALRYPAAMSADALPDTDTATLLLQAQAHADAGEGDRAMALAERALAQATAAQDGVQAAEAMFCMACCELRLLGRFGRALELAQRAALQFQQMQRVDGECRALATQSIAAGRLGYHEMAADSALLAIKLSDTLPPGRERVMAFHALGIAMFAGKCFVEAGYAYQQAIQIAQQCTPPLSTFELHIDLASTEALRYTVERNAGGHRLSLDVLELHVQRCRQLLIDDATSIAPSSHGNNLLILALAHTHLLTWQRRFDEAKVQLAHFLHEQQRLNRPWMLAAVNWARTELALVQDRLDDAAEWAQQMAEIAREHRHEALLAVAYQLISHVCERRGDATGALAAIRQLGQREQLARAESLKGRVEVIERQVELRQKKQDVQRLEQDSRLYQRLAMEDGLTGLANRRQFEGLLSAQLLSRLTGSVGLVMIDVDRFKQINDGFSHNVGDEVLRGIAQILKAQTRPVDLPARLAGDEFVIVLNEADPAVAAQVCARIQQAVRAFDWSAIAAGLQVSISLGLTMAQDGDTVVSLLARSDERMYANKRQAC